MEPDKALQMISLARKARKIELGEEPVNAATRASKARLVIVAKDASDHTYRRVKSFVSGTKQPWISVPYEKDVLGSAMGTTSCAMAAFTDVRMAFAFVKALNEPEKYGTLLEDLETRVKRVDKRQQEEKAHRSNIRHGKK